ncbi:MAG: DUF2249 domain-containing protein [Halapricum sp.]
METSIDVSETDPDEGRSAILDALASAAPGDVVTITAEFDPDTALQQAQIGHARVLTWTCESDGPGEWTAQVRVTEDEPAELVAFDVRELPPQRRHTVLIDTFERLDPGEGFVLVNDHDPKPLYHELRSTYGDVVGWEYRSRGEDGCRVAIEKTDESRAGDAAVAASFDVRQIPKPDRHPTIHHRYGNLEAGDVLELIAPHEPRPLHQEFRQHYGDAFEWEVRESEPGRCRVWITKGERAVTDENTAQTADSDLADDAEDLTVTEELDVREYSPAKRHELIFETYETLDAGEGFVLVNDHDPKPLYHQFEAEQGPEFRWEYRSRADGEFRVLIGKAADVTGEGQAATGFDAPF